MKKLILLTFLLIYVTSNLWTQIPKKGKYHLYSVYEIVRETRKGEKWEVDKVSDLYVNQIYVLNDQYILYNSKTESKGHYYIIENLTPTVNQQYAATFSKIKDDNNEGDAFLGLRTDINSGKKTFILMYGKFPDRRVLYKALFLYEDDDYKIK